MSQPPVITLDGPSGTGKGTLCHQLAKILAWHVLDSGAIYRALAFAVLQEEAKHPLSLDRMISMALSLPLRFDIDDHDQQFVYLSQQDVTRSIRAEAVGQQASKLAALPEIRAALLARQRAYAQMPGLVTDGRDMGTVVFPQANLKIYLFASAQVRAERRYLQLKGQGSDVPLAQIMEELTIRDARDMARSHSPLMPADDAVIIDTTGLTVVQVLESILQLAAERGLRS